MNTEKAVAIFGGIAVVLYVVALALTPAHAPNSASGGRRVRLYAIAHRTELRISALLIALALALLVIFAACVYQMIRRAEGADGWLAISGLASALVGCGIFGAGTALFMTIAYRPTADPAILRSLTDAAWIAYNSSGFAFGAWIALVAGASLATRMLPRWTAWVGFPIAVLNLIGPIALKAGAGPFSPQGSFALVVGITFPIWVIAISVAAWQSAPKRAATGT